jgi:plasmid maintenance system antidote protein VapI
MIYGGREMRLKGDCLEETVGVPVTLLISQLLKTSPGMWMKLQVHLGIWEAEKSVA